MEGRGGRGRVEEKDERGRKGSSKEKGKGR